MTKSATDIVPEALFDPGEVSNVIDFLEGYPLPGAELRNIFIAWARAVGANITAGQIRRVENSGVELT